MTAEEIADMWSAAIVRSAETGRSDVYEFASAVRQSTINECATLLEAMADEYAARWRGRRGTERDDAACDALLAAAEDLRRLLETKND